MSTYVSGYYRNKEETNKVDKEGSQALIALILIASILAIPMIIFWQTTLAIATAALLTISGHYAAKRRAYRLANGLIVNYQGKRRIV